MGTPCFCLSVHNASKLNSHFFAKNRNKRNLFRCGRDDRMHMLRIDREHSSQYPPEHHSLKKQSTGLFFFIVRAFLRFKSFINKKIEQHPLGIPRFLGNNSNFDKRFIQMDFAPPLQI